MERRPGSGYAVREMVGAAIAVAAAAFLVHQAVTTIGDAPPTMETSTIRHAQ